jgi:hypothetical protein
VLPTDRQNPPLLHVRRRGAGTFLVVGEVIDLTSEQQATLDRLVKEADQALFRVLPWPPDPKPPEFEYRRSRLGWGVVRRAGLIRVRATS